MQGSVLGQYVTTLAEQEFVFIDFMRCFEIFWNVVKQRFGCAARFEITLWLALARGIVGSRSHAVWIGGKFLAGQ
jgi:hypothetical protein